MLALLVMPLLACCANGETVDRLPKTMSPIEYELEIFTNMSLDGDLTFDARVSIHILVHQDTDKIVLHSEGLHIHEDTLVVSESLNYTELPVKEVTYDPVSTTMTIVLDKMALAGSTIEVDMSYCGAMGKNGSTGLFLKSHRGEDGVESLMAGTHMQPTYARRLLPCFDEPAYKAQFSVAVSRPRDKYNTLSNMPRSNTLPLPDPENPDNVIDKFQSTPNMSTYLLAVVVTDFAAHTNNDSTFNLYIPDELSSTAEYFIDIGQQVLHAQEGYTKIDFALPKLDNVAVPKFGGSMENWGLITHGYELFTSNKVNLAHVLAHEIAHQWFGNLVTLHWWSDVWLNEGFASLFEYILLNQVDSTMFPLFEFVNNAMYDAMANDGPDSHPLSDETVSCPNDINAMFDSISYDKGASVLWMTMHAIGDETFQKAVQKYLNDHAYRSATARSMLESFQSVVGEDVNMTQFLTPWLKQTGFPIILVERDYETGSAKVKQVASTGKNDLWQVPLTWTVPSNFTVQNPRPGHWLFAQSETLTINATNDEWLLLNSMKTGHYPVNYDSRNWRLLREELDQCSLKPDAPQHACWPATTRSALMHDAFFLAERGFTSYKDALDLSQYLGRECHGSAWSLGTDLLYDVSDYLVGSNIYEDFMEYIWDISYDHSFNCVPTEEESLYQTRARALEAVAACKRDPTQDGCKSVQLVARHLSRNEMRRSVYWDENQLESVKLCANFSKSPLKNYLNRFGASSATQRANLLLALPCYQDTEAVLTTARKVLDDVLEDAQTDQLAIPLLMSLVGSGAARTDGILRLLEDTWTRVVDRLGGLSSLKILQKFLKRPLSRTQIKSVLSLEGIRKSRCSRADIQMGVPAPPRISKEDWQEMYLPTVAEWLRNYHSQTTDGTIHSTTPSTETSTKPSTEFSTKPSSKPSTKPSTTVSSTKPNTGPSTKPSSEPTTESSTKPSSEQSSKPSTESSTKPSTESSTKPSTESSNKPSTGPSTILSTKPSSKPITRPSTKPITSPSTKPMTEPSTKVITKPSTESSTEPSTERSPEPGVDEPRPTPASGAVPCAWPLMAIGLSTVMSAFFAF